MTCYLCKNHIGFYSEFDVVTNSKLILCSKCKSNFDEVLDSDVESFDDARSSFLKKYPNIRDTDFIVKYLDDNNSLKKQESTKSEADSMLQGKSVLSFYSIGTTIKEIATIFMWIGIIGSVIGGIVCFYINYEAIGWILLLLGPFVSWLGSLTMRGFGQLVENSDALLYLYKNNNIMPQSNKDSMQGKN